MSYSGMIAVKQPLFIPLKLIEEDLLLRGIDPDQLVLEAELRRRGIDPELLKYSDDQPRVPAGNEDGGQWTDGDGEGLTPEQAREFSNAAKLHATNFIDARKISYISEAILSGGDIEDAQVSAGATDEHVKAANVLVDTIRKGIETDETLYRGIGSSESIKSLENAKIGNTLTLGRVTSFTGLEVIAAEYAGERGHESNLKYKYMIRTIGILKATPTDKHTGLRHEEYITHGKFKVVKVEKVNPDESDFRKIITIRQVGVF